MLELYHYGFSTCSQKVRLVLAEKGLDFVSHEVDLLGNLCTGSGNGWIRENVHCNRHQQSSTTRKRRRRSPESGASRYPGGAVSGRIALTGHTSPRQA
jgi:hypothetical protein